VRTIHDPFKVVSRRFYEHGARRNRELRRQHGLPGTMIAKEMALEASQIFSAGPAGFWTLGAGGGWESHFPTGKGRSGRRSGPTTWRQGRFPTDGGPEFPTHFHPY
jgi:hypothetical protein